MIADGVRTPGRHVAEWSGRRRSGELAAAGVYFVRYQAPHRVLARRLVLMP